MDFTHLPERSLVVAPPDREFEPDLNRVRYLTGDDPANVRIHPSSGPIWALMPATSNMTLHGPFRLHPLVKGRYFYAIPQQLLDTIIAKIGEYRFEREVLELERAAASICGDCSQTVGFLNGVGIAYSILRRLEPMPITAEQARRMGLELNQAQLDLKMRQVNETIDGFRKPRSAFLGWLLTNPTFLSEHDDLLRRWASIVQSGGLAKYRPLHDGECHEQSESKGLASDDDRFTVELSRFVARWKIQSLAAPYLPIPWEPTIGNVLPPKSITVVSASSAGIHIPDTMPLPSRDHMRRMLDSARQGQQSEPHLQDWYALIASANPAKNQLDKYERWFELQHYWRTIRRRHPDAMRGQIRNVQQAIAAFLDAKPITIERDLGEIRKRCGADWDGKHEKLPFGPY
jgi:hypothetical protein